MNQVILLKLYTFVSQNFYYIFYSYKHKNPRILLCIYCMYTHTHTHTHTHMKCKPCFKKKSKIPVKAWSLHSSCMGKVTVPLSHSVLSDSLRSHGQQHARHPCISSTPRVYSNSFPLNQWCHPTISSSVVPFFSSLQSFLALGSCLMSQIFTSDGQTIGVSASTSGKT